MPESDKPKLDKGEQDRAEIIADYQAMHDALPAISNRDLIAAILLAILRG